MVKLIFIVFTFVTCSLCAQNSFDLIINKANHFEYPNAIKDVDDGKYVTNVIREQSNLNNRLISILYLFDAEGQILATDSLINGDTTYNYTEILPFENGILVCGYQNHLANNALGINIMFFDLSTNQFDLIWSRNCFKNNTNEYNQWYTSPLIKPGTDSCFIGRTVIDDAFRNQNFIFCFDAHTGDSLLTKFVQTPQNYKPVDLFFSTVDTALYQMFELGTCYDFCNVIFKFDKGFNVIDSLHSHSFLRPDNSKAENQFNGDIILGGAADSLDYVNNILWHTYGIFRYQNDLEMIDYKLLITPHTDTTVQTAWRESLRINQDGEIFILANYNFKGFPLDGIPTIGYIAKLDSDLDLVWEKYIGGDIHYSFYGIDATADGGAVIASYCYDKNDPSTKGYAWVCKFDENGVVGVTEPGITISDVFLYPNPARDIMNVHSNHSQGTLEIYTINGQMVHKQQAMRGTQEIDLRHLKVGAYLLTLKKENKIIYSQKFQKIN